MNCSLLEMAEMEKWEWETEMELPNGQYQIVDIQTGMGNSSCASKHNQLCSYKQQNKTNMNESIPSEFLQQHPFDMKNVQLLESFDTGSFGEVLKAIYFKKYHVAIKRVPKFNPNPEIQQLAQREFLFIANNHQYEIFFGSYFLSQIFEPV